MQLTATEDESVQAQTNREDSVKEDNAAILGKKKWATKDDGPSYIFTGPA